MLYIFAFLKVKYMEYRTTCGHIFDKEDVISIIKYNVIEQKKEGTSFEVILYEILNDEYLDGDVEELERIIKAFFYET